MSNNGDNFDEIDRRDGRANNEKFLQQKSTLQGFEDNVGAMTITTMHKIRLRTKKINGKFWLLRENLEQGIISVHALSTKDQITDLLTKPLAENEFNELKKNHGKRIRRHASVRKYGVWITLEHKGGCGKNGATRTN